MKGIGNGWPLARFSSLSLPLVLGLTLLLGACRGSITPEDVVDLYLSDTNQGELEKALERWELSELGPNLVTLDAEQQRIRMDGRRELAAELTEALSGAGQRLRWERRGASYYDLGQGLPRSVEGPKEAELATVEIRVSIERAGAIGLEESVAFNLWRSSFKGWRIMSLDKGLPMLRPFLDEVKAFQ